MLLWSVISSREILISPQLQAQTQRRLALQRQPGAVAGRAGAHSDGPGGGQAPGGAAAAACRGSNLDSMQGLKLGLMTCRGSNLDSNLDSASCPTSCKLLSALKSQKFESFLVPLKMQKLGPAMSGFEPSSPRMTRRE